MISYEQYEKISSEIKAELLARLNQEIRENIKEYSANNNGVFDLNDTLSCIIPEIATFSINYVDRVMQSVLELSE